MLLNFVWCDGMGHLLFKLKLTRHQLVIFCNLMGWDFISQTCHLQLVMCSGFWQPKTRGENPTFLVPEPNPNPRIDTWHKPETRHSKPENPRVFRVSKFRQNYWKILQKSEKNYTFLEKFSKKFWKKFPSKSRLFFFTFLAFKIDKLVPK